MYENVRKDKVWAQEKVIGDFVVGISGCSYEGHVLGVANNGQQSCNTDSIKVDEELKKILQLLSKNKTFVEGIKCLKLYIQQSGGKFDYKNLFIKMNF